MYRHYELFALVWVSQLSEFLDEDAWPVADALDEFLFVGTGLLFLHFVENGGFQTYAFNELFLLSLIDFEWLI